MIARRVLAAGGLIVAFGWGRIAVADVTIGTAGQMSGPSAVAGEQMQRGAAAAVAVLNAQGGVLGQKVRLVVADDACEAIQGVAAAEKLVSQGVVFVAGHNCSSASIAASAVYQRAGVLQISPGSTNPQLTELGRPVVFRVCGRDDQQGAIAAAFLAERFRSVSIAILHDGSTYGRGLADETRRHLHERGVTEVLFDAVTPDRADYNDAVGELRAAGAGLLYYGGYAPEAGMLARSAAQAGFPLQLVSGDAIATELFLQLAGAAGIGSLFTFFPDARNLPQAASAVAQLRADGFEPEGKTLNTYAAVQVWAQAVEKAGSLEIAKVLAAMHSGAFSTVVGDLSFDANGDLNRPAFAWYVWKRNGYEEIP